MHVNTQSGHTVASPLALFDLDGTLISLDEGVSAQVSQALHHASSAGWRLAVCTGRALCLVPASVREVGEMHHYVCSNGACVTDGDGRPLMRHAMESAQVMAAMDDLAELEPGYNMFTGPEAYFEWRNFTYMFAAQGARMSGGLSRGLRVLSRFVGPQAKNAGRSQVKSVRPHVEEAHDGVEKFGCSFSDAESCLEAQRRLAWLGGFEVIEVRPTELEVTAEGVTKATGTRWLMDHLGVDARDTVAFGDGMNDASLVGTVGRFVAMGNAIQEVKDEADDVCGPVDDDGVAAWIERELAGRDA